MPHLLRQPVRFLILALTAVAFPSFVNGELSPASVSPADLIADYQTEKAKLQPILAGRDFAVGADRQAMREQGAVPVLEKVILKLSAIGNALPAERLKIQNQTLAYQGLVYALGDEERKRKTDADAASPDTPNGRLGRNIQWRAEWVSSNPTDVDRRGVVLAAMKAMAMAHPDDEILTLTVLSFYQQPADAGQKKQLAALLSETLTNPIAKQLAAQIKQADVVKQRNDSAVGAPMTLIGTDLDGKAFSTERWKGKVILVDFWATWCAPCKAELPRIKELYDKFHGQGLEVVGVDGDSDLEVVRTYVRENNLTWPNLFDAAAAAAEKPNPIFEKYGITSIPRMFLIDKKGICRSIDASSDYTTLIPKLLAE